MASCSVVLSEEQVQCSICLDVFTEPVSIPCGHNFCKACIRVCWDTTDLCYCPLCMEKFNTRPELHVNTFIAEMAAQLTKLGPDKVTPITPKQALNKPRAVPCDVCTGKRFNAVKSCLACLASYCETHLEPHHIVPSFKKHKLILPVENLEDRVCKKHERPLELFCREDQTCVCQFCTETEHKAHKTVPIEEEFGVRQAQVRQVRSEVRSMIRERRQKVKEMELSAENGKREAEKVISESRKIFSALVHSIERSQTELIEVIQEKQKAAEKKTGQLIKELEQEIAELQKRSTELGQLSHTQDHLPFLQSSPDLHTLPHTKNWSDVRVDIDLRGGPVRRAVSQLEKALHKELIDVELRMMKECAVDVTLDLDTAHPRLFLFEKRVMLTRLKDLLPVNPERFDCSFCILGKPGLSSGRFYYEVEVKDSTRWVLGVARESINRKGSIECSPEKGHWTIGLQGEGNYQACAGPDAPLHLRGKPRTVGVFVDYVEGEVTFYDVEARSHIYSFTGFSFTEKLYPCFFIGVNDDGSLEICPKKLHIPRWVL